jgi:DNA-binding transcriptional ArsR family regulator
VSHSDLSVLDGVFAALADPTRRSVLDRLARGPLSASELAEPHGMSLTGFMKHLAVLEAAGLIARAKEGRVVRCALAPAALRDAAAWLATYEPFWNQRLDALGRYLSGQKESSPWKPMRSTTARRSSSPATTPSHPKRSGPRGPTRKR